MKQKLTMPPASSSRANSRGPQSTPLLRVLGRVSEGSLMGMCREFCATGSQFVKETC